MASQYLSDIQTPPSTTTRISEPSSSSPLPRKPSTFPLRQSDSVSSAVDIDQVLESWGPDALKVPRENDPDLMKENDLAAQDGWNLCVETMDKHDAQMTGSWKEELNYLLVFAGLFSAVVTAFTVEAMNLLQEDPQARSADLLAQILQQLSDAPSSPTLSASTISSQSARAFSPDGLVVVVNVFWLFSLSLSLIVAVMAISALQWVRLYLTLPSDSAMRRASLRQRRFEALEPWRVPQIIASLSVILQLALFLFLVGLVVLLWTIHRTTAVIITATVATFACGLLVMACFAAFFPSCPYKTPLAYIIRTVIPAVSIVVLMGSEYAISTLGLVFRASVFLRIRDKARRTRHGLHKLLGSTEWPEPKDEWVDRHRAKAIAWTLGTFRWVRLVSCFRGFLHFSATRGLEEWILQEKSLTVQHSMLKLENFDEPSSWPSKLRDLFFARTFSSLMTQEILSQASKYALLEDTLSTVTNNRFANARIEHVTKDVFTLLHAGKHSDAEHYRKRARLLWFAIQRVSTPSHAQIKLISRALHSLYWNARVATTIDEQYIYGIPFALKWAAKERDLLSHESRATFEQACLATYLALTLCFSELDAGQLSTALDYLGQMVGFYLESPRDGPEPTQAARDIWLLSWEHMLRNCEAPRGHSEAQHVVQKAVITLIELYIGHSPPFTMSNVVSVVNERDKSVQFVSCNRVIRHLLHCQLRWQNGQLVEVFSSHRMRRPIPLVKKSLTSGPTHLAASGSQTVVDMRVGAAARFEGRPQTESHSPREIIAGSADRLGALDTVSQEPGAVI